MSQRMERLYWVGVCTVSHDVMWCKNIACSKLATRHREVNRLNRTLKKKLNDLQALQKRTASIRSPISYSLMSWCQDVNCDRIPHTNPNISTSQYDVEVMIHEELSDEKRTIRMKKVMYYIMYRPLFDQWLLYRLNSCGDLFKISSPKMIIR